MKNHPCGVQSTESSENYRLIEVMFDVSLRCYYKNTARYIGCVVLLRVPQRWTMVVGVMFKS